LALSTESDLFGPDQENFCLNFLNSGVWMLWSLCLWVRAGRSTQTAYESNGSDHRSGEARAGSQPVCPAIAGLHHKEEDGRPRGQWRGQPYSWARRTQPGE